ncbi:transcriptional regulator [Mangrovactinospora gilvigrisea]|uniref:transcriptional regulator n=1 Tax=Mangrovactinospora gilvigrisea TaxID=1428644 RepID=UPI000AAF6705|nr:transcriptional regulator [Mangrovactinospora gilvigrisea]
MDGAEVQTTAGDGAGSGEPGGAVAVERAAGAAEAALERASGLRNAGRTAEAVRVYGQALEDGARAGSAMLQADAYLGLGDCALDRGDLERLLSCCAKAERLLADQDLPVRAPALRGRALAHLQTRDLRYGCHLLEQAVDELHAHEAPEDAAEAGAAGPGAAGEDGGAATARALVLLYATLISPYVDLGERERAARAAEVAETLLPRTRDPQVRAYLRRQAARWLTTEGRFGDALEALAEAEAAYRRQGIRIEVAQSRWARGYVLAQQGALEEAERELTAARDELREVGSQLITMQVEVELADVWRRRGKSVEAAALLGRMLRELRGDHGAVHAAAAHHLLGVILEGSDPGAAERHYRAALVLRHQSRLAGDLAVTCRRLGDLLHRIGRTPEAVDVYRFGLSGLSGPGTTTLGDS